MRRRSRAGPAKSRRRKPAGPKGHSGTAAARSRSSPAANKESEIARLNRELAEARQQLIATADVLRVISSSSGTLKVVFETILENATRICEARFGSIYRFDGELLHLTAAVGLPPQYAAFQAQRGPFRPTPGTHLNRAIQDKQTSYRADAAAEDSPGAAARLGGARSTICVPMLKDDVLVGVFFIYRQEVRPFTEKQIAVLQNFAAQAVIAIENTRLLSELRQRTADLSESLEQQTATAEVLKVISGSPGDLIPVFESLLANAKRLCDAKFGTLLLREGSALRCVAIHGATAEYTEARQRAPVIEPAPDTALGRVLKTEQVVQIADIQKVPGYVANPVQAPIVQLAGARSILSVPMLKEKELVGVVEIYRQEVQPFTDKQIALLQNFAAQAVIAIENTRLLNELRESLAQQTATADVLRTISSSPGELEPVFQAMLENAVRICEAKFGTLYLGDADAFRVVAMHNAPPAYAEARQREPLVRPPPDSILGRVSASKQVVHDTDVREVQSYIERNPFMVAGVELGGYRSTIGVPMLKQGALIGVISIYRQEVRPFTDKQIALVQNFAAQAVIAIENARLLNELRQRTTDLSESLEQQTATADVLRVISSSPGELEPVFKAMLENATRICDANFGVLQLCESGGFRIGTTHNAPPAFVQGLARRELIFRPTPLHHLARVAATKQVVQVSDLALDEAYKQRDPGAVRLVELAGARTVLCVPMLKESELIGVIVIYRQEVRPFTDKQIALVQNFAAQAVIAIENTRLLNELRQSLEQQTATADVLRVISSSPGELAPVFQAMLENAVRICEAKFGALHRFDGNAFHFAAHVGMPSELIEFHRQRGPFQPPPGTLLDRVMRTKQVSHTADEAADAVPGAAARLGGARSAVFVPMLKDNALVGAIFIYRQEVLPFTDKQIELLKNFAAQAVIAIENTRLLNELRESLDRQTATADVLQVINSSPGDLKPVFDAIMENATRICEAKFGFLHLYENGSFRTAVRHNAPPAFSEDVAQRGALPPGPLHPLVRVAATKQLVHISNYAEDAAYKQGDPMAVRMVELAHARTLVEVPMLKEGELIGAIAIYRQEVRPFTDKQITLIQNFADQAVIAIENARLLSELRESLEQQTATSEVLKVISSSPSNIQPVLDIICERAEKLCDAETSTVCIVEGELIRGASIHGETEVGVEATRGLFPMRLTDETVAARAIRTRSVCHVADVLSDPQYQQKHAARLRGIRGALGVPMVRGDQVVGAIFVARRQPGLFLDAQVQLLKTFADQAVIAIENVRLFNETKNSLEQQTATADVLKVISRSTFDLRAVLQTLVESAARFCAADNATIIRERDGLFYTAEAYGYSREFLDYIRNTPIKAERGSASGRALVEGRVVHIPDVKADPEYTFVEAPRLGDFRTALCVPMLRENVPIGVLTLTRSEVKPFTDKQIELVTTFADQAAIAMENVRLFDEIQEKSRQLEEASQHKSQFLANMSHELRTPLNAILGYTELMADGAYGEPSEKMLGILKRLEANGRHLLGLINDVLDLSKIEAGQLVLELSDYSIQDIAQTVRSTLEPLASDKKLAFKLELTPNLPPGHGDGRRLTQVLINLVGNAIKFTDAGEVAIKAEANNGSFHVSVRDTGPGISAADQTKLFQEFQQADNAITRKKGGTGLGLAISKRIIEMHGGRIWVESQPGQGSTFLFTLPVVVEQQVNVEPK